MKKRDKNLLNDLNFWLEDSTTQKFKCGVREHGGSLDRKPVMDLMREEIIDLPTYFFVLEKQQDEVLNLLIAIMDSSAPPEDEDTEGLKYPIYELAEQAFNIMVSGNPEGEELDD